MQTKRVAAQVDGGAQVQQVLNIECLRDFLAPPFLSVRFRCVSRVRGVGGASG